MNTDALFKIGYGLYVLTAREGEKDNGCIINTVVQLTNTPNRIGVAVNKANYTHDMIKNTGVFNVCVLTEDTPFDVFKHYGFQSGKTVNKFQSTAGEERSENGVLYAKYYSNAYISGTVIQEVDLGTHTLFIADVTECDILSNRPTVTYTYYLEHIKPKPEKKIKGWVCKICGYVYEGDELPEDFICPLCKHGVADFERLQ